MKLKISRRMRFVLGGFLALVVLFGMKMVLFSSHPPTSISVPEPVHHARATAGHHGKHAATQPVIDPTLPAALRRALAHHGVVVAVLYAPDVPGDSEAVQAAMKGAQGAHAGFAALNVRNEAVATAMALKLPGISDPSVAIVRRPGTIAMLLSGYNDSEVVAQAARGAR